MSKLYSDNTKLLKSIQDKLAMAGKAIKDSVPTLTREQQLSLIAGIATRELKRRKEANKKNAKLPRNRKSIIDDAMLKQIIIDLYPNFNTKKRPMYYREAIQTELEKRGVQVKTLSTICDAITRIYPKRIIKK